MINLSDKKIEALWVLLGDIPVNDFEEIDEDFDIWKKGTSKYDIWHWFDYNHSKGLANGLMKLPIIVCPICNSTKTRQDYDFKSMRCCMKCGCDYIADTGEIILNPKEI